MLTSFKITDTAQGLSKSVTKPEKDVYSNFLPRFNMDYHMTATQNINLCLITFRIGQVYSIAQTRWEEVSASLEYLGQIQEIYLVSRQVVKCKEWVFGQRPKFPAAITTTGSIVIRVWFRWERLVWVGSFWESQTLGNHSKEWWMFVRMVLNWTLF